MEQVGQNICDTHTAMNKVHYILWSSKLPQIITQAFPRLTWSHDVLAPLLSPIFSPPPLLQPAHTIKFTMLHHRIIPGQGLMYIHCTTLKADHDLKNILLVDNLHTYDHIPTSVSAKKDAHYDPPI